MTPTTQLHEVDRRHMSDALSLAASAAAIGEVPVGAVVVIDGAVASGMNAPISSNDPTAHAEMIAIRAAAERIGNYRLKDATLYTTLEPCAMCAGAIVHARIDRVVIALRDPKAGAAGSLLSVIPNDRLNHRPDVEFGLMEEESLALLQSFFAARRARVNS